MSVFIIRNKTTLEQWKAASGKTSWNKINHAKAAFTNNMSHLRSDPLLKQFTDKVEKYKSLKFNDQDVYETVELLSETEDKLNKILTLVKDSMYLLQAYPEGSEHVECMYLISNVAVVLGLKVSNA